MSTIPVTRPGYVARPQTPTRRKPTTAPRARTAHVAKHRYSHGQTLVMGVAIVVSLSLFIGGSIWEGHRQLEIHQLQAQLLQVESNYAQKVDQVTSLSAPSQISTQAGRLHLVAPTSISQILSTSLRGVMPLPTFTRSVAVTPRTLR